MTTPEPRVTLSQDEVNLVMHAHPTWSNQQLYDELGATTTRLKARVRQYKKRYLDRVKKLIPKKFQRKPKPSQVEKQRDTPSDTGNNSNSNNGNGGNNLLPLPTLEKLTADGTDGFETFMRWFSYPFYGGATKWQIESHNLTWPAKLDEENVPRGHGKSVKKAAECQWAMQYYDYDILYLGWTDRRKQVAEYVYAFYEQRDLIAESKSPYHFKIANGGKFDCYLITAKETLGMHPEGKQDRFENPTHEELRKLRDLYDLNEEAFDIDKFLQERNPDRKLWIIIDDPIDDTFRDERHKEENLERRFDSTIYSIQPDKFSFVGTRKFEGDFFDYIEEKFGNKLVIYRRGTGMSYLDTRIGDYVVGDLLCPEFYTDPMQPTYVEDLQKGKKDLQEIRDDIGEYWFCAEYEQDPHPITGEVWGQIHYVPSSYGNPHQYDLVCITIDRAETVKKHSDYTGIVVFIRNPNTHKYIVIDDLTDKYRLDDVMDLVEDLYHQFQNDFPKATVHVVLELQGGGYAMADRAETSTEPVYHFFNNLTTVHQPTTRAKIPRILNYIEVPVDKGRIQFMSSLKGKELIKEIDAFPHAAKVDAVDALATGYNEMTKIPIRKTEMRHLQAKIDALKARNKKDLAYRHPWEQDQYIDRQRGFL